MASLLTSLVFLLGLLGAHAETVTIGGKPADAESSGGATSSEEASGRVVDLYDPVLRLNRFFFNKNIIEEHADEVPHWIVLFCPAWYEPCQALEPAYRQLTDKWQDQLNSGLLSTEVRFAAVDCATEKALCNSQNVGMNYPFVAHYKKRKQVAVWRGKSLETDEKRIVSWLQKQLGGAVASASLDTTAADITSDDAQTIPTDFLMIFVVIAGNAWFMSRGSGGDAAASERKHSSREL